MIDSINKINFFHDGMAGYQMLFCHRPARTKAGQKLISHRAHRDTGTNLFIAVERTAMKNKLGADAHTDRRPEGL